MTLPAALSELGYEPLRPLGAGGQGEAWLARGPEGLVTLRRAEGTGTLAAARVGLSHPCLAELRGVAHRAEQLWSIEEFVEGTLWAERPPSSTHDLLALGRLLLHGLVCLHDAGLAHLDIKPANLVLVPGPGHALPVLIDFGLAAPLDRPLRRSGTLGTVAPELLAGGGDARRIDLFGLGSTLLASARGHAPDPRWSLEPARLRPLLDELPARLQPPLLGLVSAEPRERFADAWAALTAWPGRDEGLWTAPERWPLQGRAELRRHVAAQAQEGPLLVILQGDEGSGRARLARQLVQDFELRTALAGQARPGACFCDLESLDNSAIARLRRAAAQGLAVATTSVAACAAGAAAAIREVPCLRFAVSGLELQDVADLRRFLPLPGSRSDEALHAASEGRPAELARLLLPLSEDVTESPVARLAALSFAPIPRDRVRGVEDALGNAAVLASRDGCITPRSAGEARRIRDAIAGEERTELHRQLAGIHADSELSFVHACLSGREEALGSAIACIERWVVLADLDRAERALGELLAQLPCAALRLQASRLARLLRDLARASRLDHFDEHLQRMGDEAGPELQAVHAYIASEAGRPEEATALAKRALAQRPELGFDVWLDLARAQQWQSDWASAERTLAKAREFANTDEELADWARLAGLVAFRLGRGEDGRRFTEEGLERAVGSVRYGLLQNLAMMERHRGALGRAAVLFAEAGEGFAALGDLRNAAIVWINSGIALQDSGELGRSQELRERAYQACRDAGLAQIRDVALAGLGIVAAARGAWTRADAWLREGEAGMRSQGMVRESWLARLHRADCRLAVRRDDEELHSLRRDFAALRREGMFGELALCWRILLERGAEDAADDLSLPWPEARSVLRKADPGTRDAIHVQLHARRLADTEKHAEEPVQRGRRRRSWARLREIAEGAARVPALRARAALVNAATEDAPRRAALAALSWGVRGYDSPAERVLAGVLACQISGRPLLHARRLVRDCAELETLQEGSEENPLFHSFRESARELRSAAARWAPGKSSGVGPGQSDLLEPLLEVHRALSRPGMDEQSSLREILKQALRIADAWRGFLVVRGESGKEHVACSLVREPNGNGAEPQLRESGFEFSRSLLDEVLDGGKARVTVNALEDPEWRFARSVVDFELASIACVPILGDGQVLGALYLDNPFESGRFRGDVLPVLESFATQVALATQAARRERQIARLNRELEGSLVVTRSRLEEAERELAEARPRRPILYCSDEMERVMGEIRRFAATDLPVHVRGETGTGKELVARKLHELSPRREGNFVSENCSAIAGEILESELFGHVQGAFTGATRDKPGLLRQAHGGTLFLDEIGDMPLSLQAKLLRALQEGEVRPVGGDESVTVDVRVITATHRDLGEMVQARTFRDDLYYRIVVARIELPPLRRRRADIQLLAQHFLETHGRPGTSFSAAALQGLLDHDWPGNVRELESAVRSAVVMCAGDTIEPEHLPLPLGRRQAAGVLEDIPLNLRDLEKLALQRALEQSGGNRAEAARLLGISRSSVFVKIRDYGLA